MTKEAAEEIQLLREEWDWDKFRREAAKDFVSAMLSNATPTGEQWATPDIVSASLEIVDELIKQLKEEEQ